MRMKMSEMTSVERRTATPQTAPASLMDADSIGASLDKIESSLRENSQQRKRYGHYQ